MNYYTLNVREEDADEEEEEGGGEKGFLVFSMFYYMLSETMRRYSLDKLDYKEFKSEVVICCVALFSLPS